MDRSNVQALRSGLRSQAIDKPTSQALGSGSVGPFVDDLCQKKNRKRPLLFAPKAQSALTCAGRCSQHIIHAYSLSSSKRSDLLLTNNLGCSPLVASGLVLFVSCGMLVRVLVLNIGEMSPAECQRSAWKAGHKQECPGSASRA